MLGEFGIIVGVRCTGTTTSRLQSGQWWFVTFFSFFSFFFSLFFLFFVPLSSVPLDHFVG